ncbi:MAG TPA: hypothetical protein VG734_07305 [Lacunisphaera sp.]|nr:hypothetical protein [Lacunisphaera sp.]
MRPTEKLIVLSYNPKEGEFSRDSLKDFMTKHIPMLAVGEEPKYHFIGMGGTPQEVDALAEMFRKLQRNGNGQGKPTPKLSTMAELLKGFVPKDRKKGK